MNMKKEDKLYIGLFIVAIIGVCIAVAFFSNENHIQRIMLFATMLFGFATFITSGIALCISVLSFKRTQKYEKQKNEDLANKFINENNDELDYIPLCLIANAYDNHHKYCRKIYNEFNLLNKDIQREVLKQLNYEYELIPNRTWITRCLNFVNDFIETNELGSSFLYDGGKYFLRAIDYSAQEYDHECETQPIIDDVFHWGSNVFFKNDQAYRNKVSFDNYLKSYLDAKQKNDAIFKANKNQKPLDLLAAIFNFRNCEEDYLCYWVMQIVESITMVMINRLLKDNKNSDYFDYSSGDAQIDTFEDRFLDVLLELYNLYRLN